MIFLLVSVPIIVLLSIVAVIPGSTTVQSYYAAIKNPSPQGLFGDTPYALEDWLIRRAPETWLSVAAHRYDVVTCTSLAEAQKSEAAILQVMLGSCSWFNLSFFTRNLDLKEARLVPKEVPLSILTRATDPNKQIRDAAFKEFDGLNLQNRDLRFANMMGAVLPKADLRHVQLQGAVLLKAKLQGVIGWDKTQLQGAVLGGTQLQGAGLVEADLQGADLRGAILQGADLSWTKLQSADLRGADLQGADLHGAQLQGADLRGAKLQGTNLRESNLQGADLEYAKLQGTDFFSAQLQVAKLSKVELFGIDWSQSNVEGVFLSESTMPAWNEYNQNKLENTLKAILEPEAFTAFQTRLAAASTGTLIGKPVSQIGCFSDNHTMLGCEYRQLMQLDHYRTNVLYPKLIELACTNAVIALGIARRGYNATSNQQPDYGLATAILNALHTPNPCSGLMALPEQIQQKLQAAAKQQK